MGYFGKLKEKRLAIKLRKRGFSYNQIRRKTKVSKDTLSRWCRCVDLTPEQIEVLLKRKLAGAERGRIISARKAKQKRVQEIELLLKQGKKDVGLLSKRDRFLIGVSLYAGEGGKTKAVQFANSDPQIIFFMMKWFREFCDVPEGKFRGSIWLHDNLDPLKAKFFWSRLTGIPASQFHKTYIVKNKTDSKKIRKNLHSFGVFSVRVSNTKIHRKILGWVSGILAS